MNSVDAKRGWKVSWIRRGVILFVALALVVVLPCWFLSRHEKPLIFKAWKLETNEVGRVIAFFTSTNTQPRQLAIFGAVRMKDKFGQEICTVPEGPSTVDAYGSFFMRAYVPTNDCVWQFVVGHEPDGLSHSGILVRVSSELSFRGWDRLGSLLNPRKLILAETPVLTNSNGSVVTLPGERWK